MTSREELPLEHAYRTDDIVELVGLENRPLWNGEKAVIIGEFEKDVQRYPVELTNVSEKPKALIKGANLKLVKRGIKWKIDPENSIQRLNLLLQGYIRDLATFAKITSRHNKIFANKFSYKMHDGIIANSMTEFDKQLNILRQTIIQSSKQQPIYSFVVDKTQVFFYFVVVLNDDMDKFEIRNVIDLFDEDNRQWIRVSEVSLDKPNGLVKFAEFKGIQIYHPSKEQSVFLEKIISHFLKKFAVIVKQPLSKYNLNNRKKKLDIFQKKKGTLFL
ncbi:hypothetical protein RFI_13615 [Reticulomyxa filosa]|uniref:Uncharacterized protein n=1 Tax=Reticulomyxa filosa TaxID=46433 RepID=X6NDY8_RETFI|nr:hypothetical protein RFI_13615 [Reticulomyxa filosa]|eukprot:ETO23562.1 hypothetical protein RFI_13615 [Reticulomyxa filosa]